MLVRLLYASRAADGIDDALLGSILRQSRENNPKQGITGILCVDTEAGVFLQALEGGRDQVSRLYNALVGDPRHRDVTLLAFGEIPERRFAGWLMGCVDLEKINPSSVLRYSETLSMDPFTMSGDRVLALLDELAGSAAIVSYEG